VIDPQVADHVTSVVAENCSASFTVTLALVGAIVNPDDGPDPDNETICGLPLPESANDSVAVRVPLAVGLKTTLAEQLAEAARLVPQVLLLIAKSPALVPPSVMPLIVMDEVIPLLRVADCAELVEPTAVPGKPIALGDTVTLPPEVLPPVPDNATVCGLLVAESEIERTAERVPAVVGLNSTDTPQLAEAATLEPQAFAKIIKSPGLAPASETPLMVIDELVPFVSVEDCAALVEPTFTDPNERDVGLTVTLPLVPPGAKPESATVCGEFVAESAKLSVAVRVPLVTGAKATLAVQLAPAARLLPHVLLVIL
jgi:hypothetical protein